MGALGALMLMGVARKVMLGKTGRFVRSFALNEEQLNALLKVERLVHHNCQVRLHDIVNAQGAPDRVAMFLVSASDGAICETLQTPPKDGRYRPFSMRNLAGARRASFGRRCTL